METTPSQAIEAKREAVKVLTSLKKSWLVCGLAFSYIVITNLPGLRQLPLVTQLNKLFLKPAALLVIFDWILMIFLQIRTIRRMKGVGIAASKWYWWLLLAVLTMWVGTLVEVGIFMAWGKKSLNNL